MGITDPIEASGVLLSNLLPENGSYVEDRRSEPDTTMATLGNLRHYLVTDLAPGESREMTINALVDDTVAWEHYEYSYYKFRLSG